METKDKDNPATGDQPRGPFTFLPDQFAGVAVLLLLYQSYQ